jgi:hypothetical protein
MKQIILIPILIAMSGLGFSQTDIELTYQSLLGGNGLELPVAIALYGDEKYLVYGLTDSDDLPVVGAIQNGVGGMFDAYFAVVDSDGSPIFSSYYGGSGTENPSAIHVLNGNEIFIGGSTESDDFPLINADGTTFSGGNMGYLTKINAFNEIDWSILIGGEGLDNLNSIDVDESGNIYVVGNTSSAELGTEGTFQPELLNSDNTSGFITKYSPQGDKIWFSYFAGVGDVDLLDIQVTNSQGNIIIYGAVTAALSIDMSGHQEDFGGGSHDRILASLNQETGNLNWATYYGGSGNDQGVDLSLDGEDNIYISGYSNSENNIASSDGFQSSNNGSSDYFIAKFDPSGSRIWGTYFGAQGLESTVFMSPIFEDGLYLMGATQSEQGLAFGNPLLEEVSIPFPQSRTVFSKFSAETGELIWSTYAPESVDCGSFRSMTILDSRIHLLGTFGQFENYPDCFEFTPDAFQSAFGGGATDFGIFHYQENFLSTSFPNAEPLAIYPNPAQDYVNSKQSG